MTFSKAIKKDPSKGDIKIDKFFAVFPYTIRMGDECVTKWLENVYVLSVYKNTWLRGTHVSGYFPIWERLEFLTKEQYESYIMNDFDFMMYLAAIEKKYRNFPPSPLPPPQFKKES